MSSTATINNKVVCWEYEGFNFQWLPYSPEVSQHLERAYKKKLTRVLLSDADPTLEQYYVNLRDLIQCCEDAINTNNSRSFPLTTKVRRSFYKCNSPAGTGTKWEWCDGNNFWHPYNIHIQCVIEESWAKGEQVLDLSKFSEEVTVNFCNLTQTRRSNGKVHSIRRTLQAPYPMVKMPFPSENNNIPSNSMNSIQIHNGNTIQIHPNSIQIHNQKPANNPPVHHRKPTASSSQTLPSSKSSSSKSTTNLARQLLNNLNIFSTKSHPSTSARQGNHLTSSMKSHYSRSSDGSRQSTYRSRSRTRASEADTNSLKSHRRPSVDTISTYLSHESNKSSRSMPGQNFSVSVNDLLDCSMGSDDVFQQHQKPEPEIVPPLPQRRHQPPPQMQPGKPLTPPKIAGSIVGIDPASDMISRFVTVVEPPKWPSTQPCPMCMDELVHDDNNPTIALSRCNHLLHLQCLNHMILDNQQKMQSNCDDNKVS